MTGFERLEWLYDVWRKGGTKPSIKQAAKDGYSVAIQDIQCILYKHNGNDQAIVNEIRNHIDEFGLDYEI